WEATRYLLDGKMFVMIGNDKAGRDIISLKLNPEYGQFLRDAYDDVYPGYYLNKDHWNSINLNGSLEDQLLKELIDQSYNLILKSLPKKTQAALKNG
ncbi:MAG: MmcQ/YjbR family DNA-binding protein, partial [Acholeplasmataceae bacterium]|nr:MmcQ/YjbR family DNA-binding protein [Acholeplasmataceae bacterium]